MQNLELKKDIEALRKKNYTIRTGSPYNFLLVNDKPACRSGKDRLIVGPDLRIYPCDAFKQIKAEEIVGDLSFSCLKTNNLKSCWENSPFLKAIRNYLDTDFAEPCKSCNILEKCLSGCLAQKLLAHADLSKRPDPMCLQKLGG